MGAHAGRRDTPRVDLGESPSLAAGTQAPPLPPHLQNAGAHESSCHLSQCVRNRRTRKFRQRLGGHPGARDEKRVGDWGVLGVCTFVFTKLACFWSKFLTIQRDTRKGKDSPKSYPGDDPDTLCGHCLQTAYQDHLSPRDSGQSTLTPVFRQDWLPPPDNSTVAGGCREGAAGAQAANATSKTHPPSSLNARLEPLVLVPALRVTCTAPAATFPCKCHLSHCVMNRRTRKHRQQLGGPPGTWGEKRPSVQS